MAEHQLAIHQNFQHRTYEANLQRNPSADRHLAGDIPDQLEIIPMSAEPQLLICRIERDFVADKAVGPKARRLDSRDEAGDLALFISIEHLKLHDAVAERLMFTDEFGAVGAVDVARSHSS